MSDVVGDPELVVSDDDASGKRKAHTAAPAKTPVKRARSGHGRSPQKRDAAASSTVGRPPPIPDAGHPDNAHGRFWYSDGTLVIAVDHVLFNVYRGRMVGQSAYLAERLRNEPGSGSVTQPLRLDNTTADDFEELMDVMVSLTSIEKTKRATSLTAIIWAGTALGCKEYTNWAVTRLGELWSAGRDMKNGPRPTGEEALECVLLCRSLELVSSNGDKVILSRAYYDLTIAGRETWAQKLPIRRPGDAGLAMKTALSANIKHALSKARDDLRVIWSECLREGTRMDCESGSRGCGGAATVVRKKIAWFDHVVAPGIGADDPVDGIDVLLSVDWKEHGWCRKCMGRNEQVWRAKLQMIWQRMDELARM